MHVDNLSQCHWQWKKSWEKDGKISLGGIRTGALIWQSLADTELNLSGQFHTYGFCVLTGTKIVWHNVSQSVTWSVIMKLYPEIVRWPIANINPDLGFTVVYRCVQAQKVIIRNSGCPYLREVKHIIMECPSYAFMTGVRSWGVSVKHCTKFLGTSGMGMQWNPYRYFGVFWVTRHTD
jgi:hypothetical protein